MFHTTESLPGSRQVALSSTWVQFLVFGIRIVGASQTYQKMTWASYLSLPLHDLLAPNSAATRERLPWHAPVKFVTPETCEKREFLDRAIKYLNISCNLTTDKCFFMQDLKSCQDFQIKCTQSKVGWPLVSSGTWLVDKSEWQRIKWWEEVLFFPRVLAWTSRDGTEPRRNQQPQHMADDALQTCQAKGPDPNQT